MPESYPVLCTLQREAWKHATEEVHEKALKSLSSCLASHADFLCRDEEPCVVICKGCNSRNIVSILVHESIHHALLWMSDNLYEAEDLLDDIVQFMYNKGIRAEGFTV